MAMFEQAFSLWTPFSGKRGEAAKVDTSVPGAKSSDPNEISELKAQLANMQQKIDKLSEDRD
jgi:polyhydroxyalkanoate synthesis regulator protein